VRARAIPRPTILSSILAALHLLIASRASAQSAATDQSALTEEQYTERVLAQSLEARVAELQVHEAQLRKEAADQRSGAVDLYNAFGSTDVIVDIVGWYG